MKLAENRLLIGAVVLLALLLRLPFLTGSFWLDEAAQAMESARPLSEQLNIAADFQPPLIHLLTYVSLRISTAEWWVRTVAALIPGLLTILITYSIGKKLHSGMTGLVASLLLATSSFHIFYSQELRPYSLPTLWAVLSWWLLWQWLNQKKKQKGLLIWFTIATILGLYSSYLYPFLALSQFTFVLAQYRHKVLLLMGSFSAAALAFAPWLPSLFGQLEAGSLVRKQLPGWEAVVSTPQLKSIALVAAKFLYGVMDVGLNWFFIISALLVVVCTVMLLMNITPKMPRKFHAQFHLLLHWLIVPLASSWVLSFWIPVVQPKRVLYELPAFYLLVGFLTVMAYNHKNKGLRSVGLLLAGSLLMVNVLSTASYYLMPKLQRENWRDLHQEIVTKYNTSNSIAVFAFTEPFAPWIWYDQGQFPTWVTGELSTTSSDELTQQIKVVSDYQYVLLFDYLRDLTDPDDRLRSELWALGYTEVETIDYPNIGFVRVFARQKPTASTQ
jgi:mannosyltransferase